LSHILKNLFSKKIIIILLIIIVLSSLSLKLYLVDFSVSETGDNWIYILRAIANSQGNYGETPTKTQGWNLVLSPFFMLIDSDNYTDYVQISRLLSIGLSSITILPMYFLARKFFPEKYSLIAASLFAFQPQLNFNSTLGYSESLFILIFVSALNFLFNKTLDKRVFLSFLLLGFLFWARFPGILFVPAFVIVYFLYYKKSKKLFSHFVICFLIFLLVVSPILFLRESQYGNPLYFENIDIKAISGSSDFGLSEILSTGFSKTMYVWGVVSLPFLIFLFPIGLWISLRKSNYEKNNMLSIWVMLFATLLPFIPIYHSMGAGRMLFHLYPLMIIFATLAIQEINEKASNLIFNKKNYIPLTSIMILIIISSILVTHGIDDYGYGRPDLVKINEIEEHSKFLLKNLDGKLLWSKGVDPDWVYVTLLEESNGEFKNYKITTDISFQYFDDITYLNPTNLYLLRSDELTGNSIEEYILNGESIGLRYISISETNDQKFFNEIYYDESKFKYLTKIFDSKQEGFVKYHVKTFEIDYDKFHEMNN